MRLWPRMIGAVALLFCLVATGAAQAETISYADSCSMTATNWTNSMDVPKFDPSLGTLTGITFYLEGNAEGNVRFESLDAQPATVTCWSQATVTLSRPDYTPIVVTLPIANTVDNVTAFDGVIDFGGTSGRTYLGLTAQDSDSVDSPPPLSDLVLFTGPGMISLPIRAVGASHATGAGNLITQFQTWAASYMRITYTYEPTPTGACCDHATGDCVVVAQIDCPFDWLGADVPCNVETCPPPPPETGACCDHATGNCTITTEADCEFTWLGVDVPCNLETCEPPTPTQNSSWGRIKGRYR